MMNRTRTRHVLIATLASTLLGLASIASAQTTSNTITSTTPVAYVYLSNDVTSSTYQINGYVALADGALSALPGSPYATKGTWMAVNGKYLFDTNGIDIYTYAIESNGSLQPRTSVNAEKYNQNPTDGGPMNLFLDHTGQSLYDGDIYIDGANNGYQAWNIISTTGQVEFNGLVGPYSVGFGYPMSFLANNEYVYGSSCVKGFQSIYGYKRASDGKLTHLNINPFIPTPTISGSAYCPYLAAADTTNHLAIPLTPFEPYTNTGPPQIAVYTAAADGSLTTTSTATNMPKSAVVSVNDIKMAPSGKLVALAGTGGVQVFHWNGAAGASDYTGLLTTNSIDQMFWDNDNHLYAISRSAKKLYVFYVSETQAHQSVGSPHSIANNIESLTVLPK